MRPVEIKKDIFWVGAVDWNSRNFHGYSRSPYGTTYNNFLIKDEKTTLVDTVKSDFRDKMLCNVAQVLDGGTVDYLVVNHLEPDHSGCLPYVIDHLKPEKVFCSPMGEKAMKAHYDTEGWPVEVMKSGSEISIGKRTLQFVETRMLHWPDNMLTYIPEDKVALTSDAFGQNIASSERYADEVDRWFLDRRLGEYYANIVLPYSPVVLKTLDALAEMDLDIDMLCPDHGLIWRGKDDVQYVLDRYREFAEQKPTMKAVVVFATMWHSTEKMAEALAEGLVDGGMSVKVMDMAHNHHSAVMTEVQDAGAVCLGSPTHNNGILPQMADMLTYMKGLRPQNKVGAAFGSFGWSGECVKILTEWMESMSFDVVDESVKVKHVPDHDTFGKCYDMGKAVAAKVAAKIG